MLQVLGQLKGYWLILLLFAWLFITVAGLLIFLSLFGWIGLGWLLGNLYLMYRWNTARKHSRENSSEGNLPPERWADAENRFLEMVRYKREAENLTLPSDPKQYFDYLV